MSLNTMLMAETMPAGEILEEFDKLENELRTTTVRFAELVHYSYHRGCLIQMSRCVVRYMVHHNCSYEDARNADRLRRWQDRAGVCDFRCARSSGPRHQRYQ